MIQQFHRFEQGYKAQIGRELATLREQQNSINKNLEEVMDKHDEDIQDEIKYVSLGRQLKKTQTVHYHKFIA